MPRIDLAPGEWVRMPQNRQMVRGLTRTFLRRLCRAGLVRSIVAKAAPDSSPAIESKGVRLIHLPSLDAYLRNQLNETPPPSEQNAIAGDDSDPPPAA